MKYTSRPKPQDAEASDLSSAAETASKVKGADVLLASADTSPMLDSEKKKLLFDSIDADESGGKRNKGMERVRSQGASARTWKRGGEP